MAKKKLITDYISEIKIKVTTEEIETIQMFSRQLVEDYGYPKEHIQTYPQYRVRSCSSDKEKKNSVDIAVFSDTQKNDNSLYIVVKCTKKSCKFDEERTQLEDYLKFSSARLGVWFNGEQLFFIQKSVKPNGGTSFKKIPNIPQFGQRVEDIGRSPYSKLKSTNNLKAVFKSIRSHLAANADKMTRAETLVQQLINIIFCKIYDEKHTSLSDETVTFYASTNEKPEEIKKRILKLFEGVKKDLPEIMNNEDKIDLDPESLMFIVGRLQNYSLTKCERDVVADAFETFIGRALKGESGQFFTPRNVVKMIVNILQPTKNDKIIDPACGTGEFLIESLEFVWERIEKECKKLDWDESAINKEKINIATKKIKGIDKDPFLSKIAKVYMNLIGDSTTSIFCVNSLDNPKNWTPRAEEEIELGAFDVVMTNPPFGSNIKVEGKKKLKQFDLAYTWKKKNNGWEKTKLKSKEAPQILFIERCLQLLKNNGRMAIVLPNGIFGNETNSYVRNWILQNAKIMAIIDIPLEIFQPYTGTKTSILILQKVEKQKIVENYPIFLSIAEYCGHNRRGKEIEKDDIPKIAEYFNKWKNDNKIDF